MGRTHVVIDLTSKTNESMPKPLYFDFDRDDEWQHIWTFHFEGFEIRTNVEVLEHLLEGIKKIEERDGLAQ